MVAVKHGWFVPAPNDCALAFLLAGTLFVIFPGRNPALVQVETTWLLFTPPFDVKFGTVHGVGTGVGLGVGDGVGVMPTGVGVGVTAGVGDGVTNGVGDGDGVGVGVMTGPVPFGGTM